jgi:hypothetical protein
MQTVVAPTRIDHAVAQLDAWLDTMRAPTGYAGPVAHWWQQSLLYAGVGLDWRYEGIITGYLTLWQRTQEPRWLIKARRAGDDLLAGQLADGHYAASAFEINPATAGTPHEAACDVGLLLLALALRQAGQSGWQPYAAAAERNLRQFYIGQLWDAQAGAFRDDPRTPSFVPNKAATACEALFLLAEMSGDSAWIERYSLPTLDRLIAHQVRGGRLDGAIAQNSFGAQRVEKYFPIYMARCIPALLRAYQWTAHQRYLDCALRTLACIARWAEPDGALPTVIYPNLRCNRYPSWIAALGDVLRAADLLRPYGSAIDLAATRQRLLDGQDRSGGIQTARGFAAQAGGRPAAQPDVRDVLHVVGWCDKALRYLAAHTSPEMTETVAPQDFEIDCTFQKRALRLRETATMLEITSRDATLYRWRKGTSWPEIAAREFWLR